MYFGDFGCCLVVKTYGDQFTLSYSLLICITVHRDPDNQFEQPVREFD